MKIPGTARRWHWLRHSPLGVRLTRYSVGSLVAAGTSEVVFVTTYGSRLLGTTAASIVAFLAGVGPNFVLNRSWTWDRRGRLAVRREVLLYGAASLVSLVAASLVSLVAASIATGWANHAAPHVTSSRVVQVALVGATYLTVYGALFVAKFALYELVVFADRPMVRHHVDTTTRPNRSP